MTAVEGSCQAGRSARFCATPVTKTNGERSSGSGYGCRWPCRYSSSAGLLWFTNSRFPGFINSTNVNQILILAMPLIVATFAQTHALLVGYIDLSVGAMISLGVVIASFWIGAESTPGQIFIGAGWDPRSAVWPSGSGQRRIDPGREDPIDHRHAGDHEHP